jgi:hypothetical protein
MAVVALSIPAVLAPLLVDTRSHAATSLPPKAG